MITDACALCRLIASALEDDEVDDTDDDEDGDDEDDDDDDEDFRNDEMTPFSGMDAMEWYTFSMNMVHCWSCGD